VRHQCVPEQDT